MNAQTCDHGVHWTQQCTQCLDLVAAQHPDVKFAHRALLVLAMLVIATFIVIVVYVILGMVP